MIFETENLEFKEKVNRDLYKEVIAFANTDGGIIYIGIDDAGNVRGIENIDETYTQITNGIRDAIQPDVTMFIKYKLQDNQVIRIEVGEGSLKPYYLKAKGLKPSGVFVRQGASSVQASREQIRQMIKDADGDIYEEITSLNQKLTFNTAKEAFEGCHIEFSEEKYAILGIINKEKGTYTNMGLLLSDQCEHTIKVAVFADQENTIFRDAKEFKGSVFEQYREALDFLNLCNQTQYVIKGYERIDRRAYPDEAVRESLLNAIIHRDYSYTGSIIVNVNDRCTEFISIGGLLPGITKEEIMNGVSQARNRNLSDVFHRMHLIEAYGTGIRRIYSLYKDCPKQPEIIVTPNSFKIILPNRNWVAENMAVPKKETKDVVKETANYGTPQQKIVIEYLNEHEEMTDEEVQSLLGVGKTRAFVITKQMRDTGVLEVYGRGVTKRYKLKSQKE